MPWTWTSVAPEDGSYTFQPGQRYAVLASVSQNFSLAEIQAKAEAQGFQVTYAWEEGQPATDPFLQNLAPDTTPNHRWIFAEGNFTAAAPWSLGVDSPRILFVQTTIWHIEAVFQAAEGAAPAPGPSPAPSFPPWAWVAVALGVGAAAWAAWAYLPPLLEPAASENPLPMRGRYYELRGVGGQVLYRTASRRLAYKRLPEIAGERIPWGRSGYYLRGATFLYQMPQNVLLARADWNAKRQGIVVTA